MAFAPHAHLSFRTIDIGTWWTSNLNPGSVNCPVVANSDALAALYADHHVIEVRRILLEVPGVDTVDASSAFRTRLRRARNRPS